MSRNKNLRNLPLPPYWEEKYDPNTKLFYYVDHAKQKTTWTDPRSWYYNLKRVPASEHANTQESIGDDDLDEVLHSDAYKDENSRNSIDDLERHESLKLTCASKTNSIVNKFLNEGYDPKHDQSHKKIKSSSVSRRSTSRKLAGRNSEAYSLSTPPSAILSASTKIQRHSISPDLRSRDAVSVDTGLKTKKNDLFATISPKSEIQSEKKVADHLKSVPETEESGPSTSNAKTGQENNGPKSMKVIPSESKETAQLDEPIPKESCEQKEPTKSNRPFLRNGLHIQAKGPNRNLLVQRIPAKGPNPDFHKGHNPDLVKGPDRSLLIRNH